MEQEIWKDIPGYQFYKGSSYGRILSFKGNKNKILSPIKISDYLYINLCINGKSKKIGIHRIVASIFYGLDLNDKKQIACHKDDNPFNNHKDNIFVGTQKDNLVDMSIKKRNGGQSILQYSLDNEFIKEYDSMSMAGKHNNISPALVRKCCLGQIKKGGGFIWKFKPLILGK